MGDAKKEPLKKNNNKKEKIEDFLEKKDFPIVLEAHQDWRAQLLQKHNSKGYLLRLPRTHFVYCCDDSLFVLSLSPLLSFMPFFFSCKLSKLCSYLPHPFCFCSYWWGFGSFVICSAIDFFTKVMQAFPAVGIAVSLASSSTLSCFCDVLLIVVVVLKSMLPTLSLNAQKARGSKCENTL
jgi:hypothetical protein